MNKTPPPLIHIGLPKTATTYLQTLWSQDPSLHLVYNELAPLISRARQEGWRKEILPTAITAPIEPVMPLPGRRLIISNEALSNAYVNERASKEQIRCFQEWAAAQTKALIPKAKILIVVREPESWIRSIYNQAIKQGGGDTFRQFLRRECDYLEQSLNIRDLFTLWKKHYGSDNVLILPMELLRDDETTFLHQISRFSGINLAAPSSSTSIRNPSLREESLDVMRQFNKWVSLVLQHGTYRGELPEDVEQALSQIRFAFRYQLESPTPALRKRLHRLVKSRNQTDAEIPRTLLKEIRSRISKQLKKDHFFGYRKLYS